jgi:hypothetical protein
MSGTSDQEPSAPADSLRLAVNSFDQLMDHEQEIVERIATMPNGGHLFMIHPFRLLQDIGVTLSEQARAEIIGRFPELSTLSLTPYNNLKRTRDPQPTQYHLRGLFPRRAP